MLQEILHALQSDQTLSTEQLAKKLDTTPQMVLAMLQHLETLGYLKQLDTCTEACAQCPLGSICQAQKSKPSKIWQVTARRTRNVPSGIL